MESSNTKMKREFEEYKKIMDEKVNIAIKNELEKIQNENEKKIKHLEDELIEKENYINELKNCIGFIKNDFTNLIDKGKILSSIINFGDLYLIEEGIQKKFNKKIKKCELLYRYSLERNEDFSLFTSRCLNADCSIIILVMTRKGNRFGGFTHLPSTNSKKTTTNIFCFSFDKQKLYYKIKYVYWDNTPIFENNFKFEFDHYYNKKKCKCDNKDFGFIEDFFDYEAHRIYLE